MYGHVKGLYVLSWDPDPDLPLHRNPVSVCMCGGRWGYRMWISVTDGLVEPEPHGGGAQRRHVRVERHGRKHSRALPEGGRGPVHLQRQVDKGALINFGFRSCFFPEGQTLVSWIECRYDPGFLSSSLHIQDFCGWDRFKSESACFFLGVGGGGFSAINFPRCCVK